MHLPLRLLLMHVKKHNRSNSPEVVFFVVNLLYVPLRMFVRNPLAQNNANLVTEQAERILVADSHLKIFRPLKGVTC